LAIALIEAADCCGISAEKDDADQRAGNANPPHSLVLSIALKESFNGDGAVVSYLNNVRGTKETIVKLRHGISVCVREPI
jgi:hypothetical protein